MVNPLGKRFIEESHLHDLSVTATNEYTVKDYAESVNLDFETDRIGRDWHLPHHPVVNPHKPNEADIRRALIHGEMNRVLLKPPPAYVEYNQVLFGHSNNQ
ncbi:hypothetical protein CLF_105325 [Clonorchis sinensis]|uniref:Uncharacterized protein n=1 Tax=Clonorchis sinensis TaxID=79923 RepID=G7YDD9_CLOSI|nr:hypothetical protein CLF_105325 [Clonorchis sinensis]